VFADGEIHYFDAAQFEKSSIYTGIFSSDYYLVLGDTTKAVPGSTLVVTSGTGTLSTAEDTVVITNYGPTATYVSLSVLPLVSLLNATVGMVKPYQDARRVDLYLDPIRTNQLLDPGFEGSSNKWTASGISSAALDTANVYPTSSSGLGTAVSTYSKKLVSNSTTVTLSTSYVVPITSNKPYSLSGYFKTSGTGTVSAQVKWKDITLGSYVRTDVSAPVSISSSGFTRVSLIPTYAAGSPTVTGVTGTTSYYSTTITALSSTAGISVGMVVTGTNILDYTYVTAVGVGTVDISYPASDNGTGIALTFTKPAIVSMNSPANAYGAEIKFTMTGNVGDIYYVDSTLFEISTSANAYFDGGTGYFNNTDLIWEQDTLGIRGTAITARSSYYPNRLTIQSRLNTVLSDYLPMGSTYALFIGTSAT
jgi:hypothetical protein